MALKTRKWDVTEHLGSDEEIALYLEAVFEDGDPALITAALGDVARAIGMTEIARRTGFARESLYRALSEEGKPGFDTVIRVLKALGVKLTPVPAAGN
ncbi:MAG: putative addiction module antidote protein [Alphaproteobacteria bacterium]|nr:putative addiction module antidote protein [Alphaproteobacteria bacterium]